ncbi:glycosyltransferase family 1 protein [Plicaturopsis crispa FD-325 SS-3]|nr:glycosyltransferase family 1 protein [Plicaturopsis crispa FD-325 SS-3]
MRAGTQTLIQALQAIPWTDDPDQDDEILNHGLPVDSESDDEAKPTRIASSIHTIHRPVARSRRADLPPSPASKSKSHAFTVDERDDDSLTSDEDIEGEDLEASTPRPPDGPSPGHLSRLYTSSAPLSHSVNVLPPSRSIMSRTGSMATVRLQRRSRLAEKLKEVFELEGIEEVWAEMPCWILRSVLLQGYMYLTNSYICFFAHMPSREDQILKSGTLNKKATRTKRWIKHWFILKNDALSWYQSSSDPYFPHGIVDLRYAISCEPQGEKDIHLRTNAKTIYLSADSVPSREEWVKAIRKVIFKAQNMGDSIAIPYSAILDVEKSTAMDFSETIEVKVREDHFSVDSYFFAYFHDLQGALEQIRDAVRAHRTLPPQTSPRQVLDTTLSRSPSDPHQHPAERAQTMPESQSIFNRGPFSLTGLLSPLRSASDTPVSGRGASSPANPEQAEGFTHITKRPTNSLISDVTPEEVLPNEPHRSTTTSTTTLTPSSSRLEHTYPPSTPTVDLYPTVSREASGSAWTVGVPSWLRGSTRKILPSSMSNPAVVEPASPTGVSEVYSSTLSSSSSQSQSGDLGYSVLESPEGAVDGEMSDKYHTAFAFDDKETLLGYFTGYIFRLLPVYGRLYVSTNYFCFKSSGPLTAKTWMVLPIKDILATERTKATRFGHLGLIVIVKGHEELFFEFGDEGRRNAFVKLLESQMEDVRQRLALGEPVSATAGERDALILEEFEAKPLNSSDEPRPAPDNMADSLPAVMFTSASSTFLTFKPKESLNFTFLTIGSRGDVQPYIALAKGLIADGHKAKIATHGEFKDWIEAHGIEFGYVGGDPAELMRICVENGMFTVAFLKEGLQKFRGWVDDLLKTSWEACQGSDVLVESPSAMGGYHIAEALGIPYFRAFTMTWTRTRAYPHAFAVPDRKMGGSYNYMSYVMFDQVFWRATSGQINRWRRNQLGLAGTSLDKMEPHKIPFLYNFSPVVVPPPLDWPEWIRVTGYWFLDDAEVSAKKWNAPSDLDAFIDNAHSLGKKVVYIGFGSIVVSDPRAMTRCVIEAVVKSGVYAILSKGWSDRLNIKSEEVAEPEEPLPKEIYAITSVPHDWLFQRIDAACHHGGAGTTGASLRAGIPTIIKPFFGDQFFWADRVEALGVGSGVRKLTVDSLMDALIAATTDSKQIYRAKLIGEQIRSENGVATAIEAIYRDLEYARSLIKRAARDDLTEEAVLMADNSTIRDEMTTSPVSGRPLSGYSSSGRTSEDWSVVSDGDDRRDDRRSSFSSRRSEGKADKSFKRKSLAAAVLSVLPDSLAPTNLSHRRSRSSSSAKS